VAAFLFRAERQFSVAASLLSLPAVVGECFRSLSLSTLSGSGERNFQRSLNH